MRIVELKTKPRLVSIVIPNYITKKAGGIVPDESETLWFARHCFPRIKKYTTLPYELVLIDNGSEIGHDLLSKWADVLITNESNLGFAPAVNQGINLSKGDMVVVINNDIFVWDGWLEALVKTFEDNSDCGIAMPALMKQTKRGREALKFEEIDLTKNYFSYGKGAEFGSCFLIKREIIDKVKKMNNGNMYDERFLIGFGEDRNLYRQIRMLGYETYRTHKTRVFHQGNVTMSKIKSRKSYTHPNRIYFHKLLELEVNGKRLTEREKDKLRKEAQKEYEESLNKLGSTDVSGVDS